MTSHPRSNIVLIGMPGAGKSTVGVILAKHMALQFVDTDVLIQASENRSLQDIMDAEGYLTLRMIEEQTILGFRGEHHVVATGGSAVYSEAAMEHLQRHGIIIYLQVGMETLLHRVHDFDQRGIARRPDQTFSDLCAERAPLYERYAEFTVSCDTLDHETTADTIRQLLSPEPPHGR